MTVNEKMTSLADAIREKTGGTEPLTLDGMTEAVQGMSAGGGSDDFIMMYGTELKGTFYKSTLPENTEIVFNMPNFDGVMDAFALSSTNLKSFKMISSVDIAWFNILNAFNECRTIELIDFSECNNGKINPRGANESRYAFRRCDKLKEIKGELDLNTLVEEASGMFQECHALEKITFKEQTITVNLSFSYSKVLNDESIQSIIDGLKDLTGTTAQKITFHTDVISKLTESQITQIGAKNWNLG